MRLGNRPERDPREAALADVYRGSMSDQSNPRRAALADLADPAGEPVVAEGPIISKADTSKSRPSPDSGLRFTGNGATLRPYLGSVGGHSGPAMERYALFAGDTNHIRTPEREARLRDLYREAGDEAQLKGVFLPGEMRISGNDSDVPRGMVQQGSQYDDPSVTPEDTERRNRNVDSVRERR